MAAMQRKGDAKCSSHIDRWKRRFLTINAGMESYGFVKYSDSPRGGYCLKRDSEMVTWGLSSYGRVSYVKNTTSRRISF